MSFEEDPGDADDRDDPLPRDPETISMHELENALAGLTLLGSDLFLRMQATNIALVDKWMMRVETDLLRSQAENDRYDIEIAAFLNAQSQMWLFGLYELLRTWRERVKDVRKWHENGGLGLKLQALQRGTSSLNVARQGLVQDIQRVIDDPSLIDAISEDLARIHVVFGELEFLRIALAKHQVSGRAKSISHAPGYARINRWTGSMSYQLSGSVYIMGEVTRRSFADGLRHLMVDRSVPSQEDRDGFDAYMKALARDPD